MAYYATSYQSPISGPGRGASTVAHYQTISGLGSEAPTPATMGNPAAENCVRLGGRLVPTTSPAGQGADCVLPNGIRCEEWKLFRGQCGPTAATTPRSGPTRLFDDVFGGGIILALVAAPAALGYAAASVAGSKHPGRWGVAAEVAAAFWIYNGLKDIHNW